MFTIAQVRAFTATDVTNNPNVFTSDSGKEGWWYYDSSDTTSTDNTGTILVATTPGARYKRADKKEVLLQWFGAVGDGTTNDTTAIQNACAAAIGRTVYVKKGTYLVNNTINIFSNIICEKDAVFKVANSYSGVLFQIKSLKGILLQNLYIDAQGTSIACTGLKIAGLWNSTIDSFSFLAHASDTSSVGIDIYSSDSASLGFGTYVVSIPNPYILRGNKGIRTQKTASDTVENTHINIYGGWISSQNDSNLDFSYIHYFGLYNTALDIITGTGIKVANAANGEVFVGEYNSGKLIDISSSASLINLKTTANIDISNTAIVGGTNFSSQTANRLRLNPTSDPDYWVELRSNYNYANPFEFVGKFGSSQTQILSYQDVDGLKPKLNNADNSAGSQLIGINAGGGLVKLGNSKYSEGTAAPASGTWSQGDFRKNTAPTTGSYFGWVCTSGGTPGTWVGYGAL